MFSLLRRCMGDFGWLYVRNLLEAQLLPATQLVPLSPTRLPTSNLVAPRVLHDEPRGALWE